MYYHARELKFVEYGKVVPAPESAIESDFANAYRWLGKYCGFFPQVWLARSRSSLTAYRRQCGKYGFGRDHKTVMFGFDNVRGFPVEFGNWHAVLNVAINLPEGTGAEQVDTVFHRNFQTPCSEEECIEFYGEDRRCWPEELRDRCKGMTVDDWLQKHLFRTEDQVVVPALNLKAAKKIFCRDERQKKALRKMGFIEDRIRILPQNKACRKSKN